MNYSKETAELIERQCRNVEREDFKLNKKQGAEAILKTYDLFGLKRPKKIVWVKDIFDKRFLNSARRAWKAGKASSIWDFWITRSTLSSRSAGIAGSAWRVSGARRAWIARNDWVARSAGSAGSAWSANNDLVVKNAVGIESAWRDWVDKNFVSIESAWRARDDWIAKSAGSAGSDKCAWSDDDNSLDWTALDKDFDFYIFEFEYVKNPDKAFPPNENDYKYLEYCELLMKAKEYGVGYRIEWKDVLYLAPTPLIKIDERNRFHSTKVPAIRWKGGHEFYYLQGLNFKKDLWTKIVNDKLTANQVFKIKNLEQRRIAYEMMDKTKMKSLKNYKVLDEAKDDLGKPMKIISFEVKGFEKPFIYYQCVDATTDREYFIETDKTTCFEAKAGSFGFKADEIKFDKEY